ncbi:acylphosphatase [Palleronia aestuarii]|uniref:Acylphosphatase n=1 Tax=Palleronia aestuarii TaxID=568105 RepID=A0A2W7N5W5_9RHOB|nr:acylphosphatase [Palleronia aestuarii]PZX15795.1 acylphosphatase [Palleronia aestuarii]
MPQLFTITGRVQGVGFRAFTKDVAEEIGIRGWVRNRADGSVEALADGDLDAFEARLRKGPPASRVEGVTRTPSDEPVGDGFAIRR